MENLEFEFRAEHPVAQRAHVGVVGSGDLEILIEPADASARVQVCTSVDGYGEIWRRVLQRFFERHPVAASLRINDFGATPGVVALRLEQALEASRP
ncbi:malonate decarboxylase subunit delta [Thiomonas sp.]|jgi:malonate decarboxylase acyl carrier protein|uniref:malonate decarboxylase subunit delta n=1 Tax=Thiomonas sp. TaxID=2047785 RepID=UPI00262136A9|nr:malonate decarboxylase subunit delta [Thiomonas sp.]